MLALTGEGNSEERELRDMDETVQAIYFWDFLLFHSVEFLGLIVLKLWIL